MRTPGTCPGCGADWRVGPRSRGLVGVTHCRCAGAVGGTHFRYECKDCAAVVVDGCEDSTKRARVFSYERGQLE